MCRKIALVGDIERARLEPLARAVVDDRAFADNRDNGGHNDKTREAEDGARRVRKLLERRFLAAKLGAHGGEEAKHSKAPVDELRRRTAESHDVCTGIEVMHQNQAGARFHHTFMVKALSASKPGEGHT